MSTRNRKYSGAEKLKIALEVLREEVAVAELCKQHNLGKSTVHRWVQQLKAEGGQIYEQPQAANQQLEEVLAELEQTRARLGAVVVENAFLKKASSIVSNGKK